MAEKRAAYEYYVPPELRPFTRKVAPFVKGVNTGIAELAGFPVYLANLTPTLINLLPGKQGMKPFSEKPLGGAQTFKDLMAAGNIDTYKDLQSISKNEYGAGVTGMLLGEALLSMFPVKRAVDALMAGKKGKKDALPTLTAGGVDLSKRDLFKKAGAAAVSAAMAPSILREAGDIAGAAVKTAKVVPKGAIISRARDLASDLTNSMIKDLFMSSKERKRLGLPEKPDRTLSDKKTVELNTLLEDFLKGKTYEDLMKLSKNDKAELYNLKQTSHHSIIKKDKSTGRVKEVEYGDSAGDPLRSKEYGPLLDKVFKDSGIGVWEGKYTNRIPNFGDPPPRNLLADPSAFNDAFGLKMLPSDSIIKKAKPSNPLGPQNFKKEETAYHFTFPEKVPGSQSKNQPLDIKKFDLDVLSARNKGYSVKYADTLGVHVGSQKAAQDRFLNVTGMFDEKEIGKEVGFDVKGQTYPVKIDTSKPFLDESGEYSKDGVWTEDGLENYIQEKVFNVDDKYKKIMKGSSDPIKKFEQTFVQEKKLRERALVKQFRKELADEGFTNVPYLNDYEGGVKQGGRVTDASKEISQIMLIDRPKGDKVITSTLTGEPMAKGGIAGLSDVARDMFKGPKGIGTYESFMVG